MPEIKIKHVVSFSSEDKVHKAENLLKEETYRKWKCATPGEKNATVVLQFEKATKIHSIDIGNEGSAFVEVLVGRSSDSVSDYQVLLVASSFMSPLESRNGTHTNRVRMFGPENLSKNTKDEKWDCVQIVCTQPFSKNLQYGLTFIRFHSPPEKIEEQSSSEKPVTKLGAFKLKDDDEDDTLPFPSTWFGKQRPKYSESSSGSNSNQASPSFAAAVLASANSASKVSSQDSSLKRKAEEKSNESQEPPSKKTTLNKDYIVYKDVLRDSPQSTKASDTSKIVKKDAPSPKVKEKRKEPPSAASSSPQSANNSPARTLRQKVPLNKIMDKVVFALSGFVNPLRSDLRDKALKMGAKYRPDWDSTCTHLVCAFAKTPKYEQVKKVKGRIVTKEWILDSYQKKEPLLWKKYELSSGDSSPESENDDSDADPHYKGDGGEEEEDSDVTGDDEEEVNSDNFIVDDSDDEKKKKKKSKVKVQKKEAKNSPRKRNLQSPNVKNQAIKNTGLSSTTPTKKAQNNISDSDDESSTPKKKGNSSIFNKLKDLQQKDDNSDNPQSPTLLKEDESETEDEDALQDYVAATDVEGDSSDDTEDEIRKVEEKTRQKKTSMNGIRKDVEFSKRPDVSDLPLPDLPNFFKKRHFFLYGDFSPSNHHQLKRCITAYNGVLEDYMSDTVKYVITEKKWDKSLMTKLALLRHPMAGKETENDCDMLKENNVFRNHFATTLGSEALNENEDLIFVKPTWIYKCHEAGKLVPYQPHIVIPDT